MPSHGCYHSLPARHRYAINSKTWTNDKVLTPVHTITPFEERSLNMKLDINNVDENVLEIIIYDPTKNEYPGEGKEKLNTNYNIKVFTPNIYVEVYRNDNDDTIFSSARGPFISSNTYFEWSIHLNADYMMGLGAESYLQFGEKYLLFNNKSDFSAPFVIGFSK